MFVHCSKRCLLFSRVIFLGVCIVLPSFGLADDYLDMKLEELLEVKITGATLRDESIKTAPSSVTVFTREQLDVLGLDYLYELMNIVPGFQVTRAGDAPVNYTFSTRGRRLGARAREILLLVDGRAFSDPRSGGADSAVALYPLANIERIEIIRGPGSAIYGSGAYTGVINVISRREENRLLLAVGSDERRKADINLSKHNDDWQFDLYAHAYEDAGQQYNLASNSTIQDPRREAQINMDVAHNNTRMQVFSSLIESDDFYVFEKIDNDFNFSSQRFEHFRVEQALQPADNWNTTASINFYKVRQDLHGVLVSAGVLQGNSVPASAEPMLAKVLLAGEAYRADVANDITLSNDSSVQFGGEWRHERETDARANTNYDIQQLVARDFPINYYEDFEHGFAVGAEQSRDVAGVYGQLLHNLTNNTRLTLGGRYDYYQDVGEHVSPRVALVHQLNRIHALKLLYGEAFRAPSFAETHLLNNPVLVGNPELENETVDTLELLWIGTWETFSAGTSIYYNEYKNPISTGLVGTTRTFVNGPDEENYGIGFRVDWQISPNWLVRVNHTRTENLPDSAFREADKLAILTLNYNREQWNWNLSANFQDERQYPLTQTQRATLKAYWIANSKLRYQLQKSTSVNLAVKNLLDEDYASPSQGMGISGGIPNREREIQVGLEWGF